MKVSISNLGVIKEAQFELKPLTVLLGPNNVGKTWLAYSLAGILSPLGSGEYIQAYADTKVPNAYETLDTAIERVLAEGNATIDLRRFADEYGEQYFNDIARYARNWMGRFFGTALVHFDDLDISLNLAEAKAAFVNRVARYSLTSRVAGSVLTIRKSPREDRVFALTSTEGEGAEEQAEQLVAKIPPEEVKERLISFVATALRRSLYPQIRVFPTERTTLVTFRFAANVASAQPSFSEKALEALETLRQELDIRELARSRAIGQFSGPVGSFMSMLDTIFRYGAREKGRRQGDAEIEPKIGRYIQLAEILENHILTGGVDFSTPEPDPRREVWFQPTADATLEMPIVSSMVKELAPLVLYLRYLARPGELLIIDEPEMNLHPAAQVKIVEFLAMLVNAGLNVLITTHSTYVVDHLVNLMDAYKQQDQDEIAEKFLLEQKEAFIAQDKVAAYLVDKGKVSNILDPEGSIDWKTFSDVTRLVQQIHFELSGA